MKKSYRDIKSGWSDYIEQRVFRASLAYCFLYATVLCLGDLDTAYLKSTGIEDVYLALARGVSALVGILSTFIMPILCK